MVMDLLQDRIRKINPTSLSAGRRSGVFLTDFNAKRLRGKGKRTGGDRGADKRAYNGTEGKTKSPTDIQIDGLTQKQNSKVNGHLVRRIRMI